MNYRTIIVVACVALVSVLASAQEKNPGYEKTDPNRARRRS